MISTLALLAGTIVAVTPAVPDIPAVSVFSCRATPTQPPQLSDIDDHGDVRGGLGYEPQANVRISFTNRAAVSATEVEFSVVSHGVVLQKIVDKGTFAPGTQINHRFLLTRQVFPKDDAALCQVQRVTFSNHTSWTAASTH